MSFELTPRERRWLDIVLILAAIALTFVVLGFLANLLAAFGDIILIFFLAWLLAFILTPLVTRLASIAHLTRAGAVVVVYVLLFGGLLILVVGVAGAVAASIRDFIANVPTLRNDLPTIMAPWQERLNGLGLTDVNLTAQGAAFLDNLSKYAAELAGPLQQVAVASLGAIANLLLILILSLYMVADRDRLLASAFRLAPPQYKEEARLLERSVARVVRRLPARAGDHGSDLRRRRARRQHRVRAGLRRGQRRGRRAPHGHPVLRPVPGMGAAGSRGTGHAA